MVASRIRVMGASYSAPFWLSAFCIALMPTSIGYQDLAALVAHRPAIAADWRDHLIASPFGTIEPATYSYSRPIGTSIPEPLGYQTVNFDPRSLDGNAWRIDGPLTARPAKQVEYPSVNRALKGDRQPASNIAPAPMEPASLPQLQPISAPPAAQPVVPAVPAATPRPKTAEQSAAPGAGSPDSASPILQMDAANDASTAILPAGPRASAAANAIQPRPTAPPQQDNVSGGISEEDIALDKPPEIPGPGDSDANQGSLTELSFIDGDAAEHSSQIYFGGGVLGSPSGLQRWAPGAEPILVPPSADSDIKLSALEETDSGTETGGETVAGKDDAHLLESPAQRLGLSAQTFAKSQKCLADAVYFEARGEVEKGQEAVAQVVMNRVFSGYYPNDVCGVVYQNASRHLRCQFTFACEGKDLSAKDEPDMWEQAKRIARDMLNGKIWLAEVGHATHYHAYWVHPSWVHEMTKLYHLGVHTFYRPRAWGDGDDAPVWGAKAEGLRPDPEVTAENPESEPKSPEAAVKSPQAEASPEPAAVKSAATAKL